MDHTGHKLTDLSLWIGEVFSDGDDDTGKVKPVDCVGRTHSTCHLPVYETNPAGFSKVLLREA